jgi:hypothetical protein
MTTADEALELRSQRKMMVRWREQYASEAKAIFTQTEFNRWLIERIAAYHAEEHSQLGMSPLER